MLRDYQRETLEAIRDEYAQGVTRQLVVKPTGTGKAVDFAHLPNYMHLEPGQQMLLLVHRDELVYQGAEKCRKYNPRLIVDIEKAEYRARPTSDIIVASVQTLRTREDKDTGEIIYGERLERFDPERFRIIVVDEAHHAVAASYKNILRYFRVLKGAPGDPAKLLVGFTATPKRGDSIGLEEIFDKIVFQRNIRDMVEQKYLADITAWRVNTTCDISQVKTRAGDFAEGQLSDAVDTFERNRLIVQEYQKLGEGLTAVAFTVSIQHSEDLAEVFRDRGISAHALSGNTPQEERRELIRKHESGEIKVLASCGVLCLDTQTEILTREGWKNHETLSYSDDVANWEVDGSVCFAPPQAIVVRNRLANERMISLESEDHNLRVTENHRMVYRTNRQGLFKVKRSSHLVNNRHQMAVSGNELRPPVFKIHQPKRSDKSMARRLASRSYNIRKQEGLGFAESKNEASRRLKREDAFHLKAPHELTLDECMFIGFWIGDGAVNDKLLRGGREYILCQSKTYPKIINWIDNLISRLGLSVCRREHPATAYTTSSYVTWHLCRGTGGGTQERSGVYPLEPYLNKDANPLLWGLTADQFEALITGLWYADGEHGDGSIIPKTKRISGSRRKPLDLLQAIAVCRGYHTNLQPDKRAQRNEQHALVYRLTLRKRAALAVATRLLAFESHWKQEKVWCVTSDTGKIIVRRCGKAYVTGNSEGWDNPRASVAIMARPTKSSLLYIQQVGRVLRPYPAPEDLALMRARGEEPDWIKEKAIILDFVDQTGRHEIITTPTLFGLRADFQTEGKSVTKTKKAIEDLLRQNPGLDLSDGRTLQEIKAIVERVDLLRAPKVPAEAQRSSKFSWLKDGDGYRLNLPGFTTTLLIRENSLGQFEVSRLDAGVRQLTATTRDLSQAFIDADSMVPKNAIGALLTKARWRQEPPTEKQTFLVWRKDRQVREQFSTPEKYYDFAYRRWESGNMEFSKGAFSVKLDSLQTVRPMRSAWPTVVR